MTKNRKASPAQLAALAAGRAKAKALRDQTPAPVTLDFVQLPKSPVETFDHAGARTKLKTLGLQAAQLPGRGKAIQLAGWTITNAKGKFSFASEVAAPAPQPKSEIPAPVLAWLAANGFKL
jgi:hypothetical protein